MNDASPKQRRIRVLHLEDNERDHVLVREMLHDGGLDCDFEVAHGRSEYEDAIRSRKFDVIISDYSLPSYDGHNALTLARQFQHEAPFIFFSATMGEELAVESLKIGATDYVVKQRPHRLVSAVRRALEEVTEQARRKAAEAALRQSEEHLRLIALATNDVVWEWDLTSDRLSFSENFEAVFGYVAGQISDSRSWKQCFHPEDRERIFASITAILANGGRVWWGEYRFCRANTSYAHVLNRGFVVYDSDGHPRRMVGAMLDFTGRKLAEEKIREQAALLDKASDAIILCDLSDRIIYWNHGAERIYGWPAHEATGRTLGSLLFDQTPLAFDLARKTVLVEGEWKGEFEQITRAGDALLVQSSWTLVRDNAGVPKSKLIINTNITEQKRLEEKFLRAQRLESIGELVGGIAHDLNNALSPVLMGAGILRTCTLPDDVAEILNTMVISAQRGADMVKQIMAFARGSNEKAVIHVDHLIREMGKIIADTFPRTIQCRVKPGRGSWLISGLSTQLHQVIMNLCVNARDAMPEGGTLTLSTTEATLDELDARRIPDAHPGRYVCFTVADSGAGIPEQLLRQIFTPFFTTKAPGKGTGLGLSTSQGIVKSHGGFMTVESKIGRGSEFRVYLPALDAGASVVTQAQPRVLPTGNGEQILVVDDEAAILAIARSALENHGYRVITATGGPDAVSKFTHAHADVSLVITDLSMPFMDGIATTAALRKIKPNVKIIAASGLDQQEEEAARSLNAVAYIQKPFTIETLINTVHEVLSGKVRKAAA